MCFFLFLDLLSFQVSGHITFETVTSFLSDFHHEDREDVDVEAVFLHPDEPELEFEGFLKKQYPRVRYFQGSLMESEDLALNLKYVGRLTVLMQ
jgi:potassium large conductance calcium-activated channel subfamily M alpha protein 1